MQHSNFRWEKYCKLIFFAMLQFQQLLTFSTWRTSFISVLRQCRMMRKRLRGLWLYLCWKITHPLKHTLNSIAQVHKMAPCWHYEIKVKLSLGLNNYAQHRKDIWGSQVIAPSLLTFALNGQLQSIGKSLPWVVSKEKRNVLPIVGISLTPPPSCLLWHKVQKGKARID